MINAGVVEDLGMAPNWLFLIFAKMAGFTCSFTTNSSATLDKIGVSDIGRRSLLISFGVFFLWNGHNVSCFPRRWKASFVIRAVKNI